jgi:hypothetical protein
MPNFHSAAVRFGKPGALYVAAIGSTEPTTVSSAWDAAWYPLGYTDTGSVFNYNISVGNVEVAEQLDVFARVTEGRDATVEFSLAETTKRNLQLVFNGGVLTAPDGQNWSFEPPDLGSETRVMLGWDANPTVASNDLRWIFRQCLQTGSLAYENRKGTQKSNTPGTFGLEVPATGAKILKIMGSGLFNPTS